MLITTKHNTPKKSILLNRTTNTTQIYTTYNDTKQKMTAHTTLKIYTKKSSHKYTKEIKNSKNTQSKFKRLT